MKRNLQLKTVKWGWAIAGALAAEAAMIAAAFIWVAIYSHVIRPGEPFAVYQAYAKSASPFVSLVLGIPVFYMVCRWVGRRLPASAVAAAVGVFCVYSVIEFPMMLAADNLTLTAWFAAINFPTKFLGCYWGGVSSLRQGAVTSA